MPENATVVADTPQKGGTYYDAEHDLYVRVTKIDHAYIHYEGDADGYARPEEFSKRFVRRDGTEAGWTD